MARAPRNELAMKDFATHLDRIRSGSQADATPMDIVLWLWRDHSVRLSEETVRKALTGQVDPTTCSVDLLVGLAAFYGASPAQLGRFAADRVGRVLALVDATSGGPEGGNDLPIAQSR